jgi:quinol monooxygenase YgiN
MHQHQDKEDPTKFMLVEIYRDDKAPAAHKETAHYAKWRDTVADMMNTPRQAYVNTSARQKVPSMRPTCFTTTMGLSHGADCS